MAMSGDIFLDEPINVGSRNIVQRVAMVKLQSARGFDGCWGPIMLKCHPLTKNQNVSRPLSKIGN